MGVDFAFSYQSGCRKSPRDSDILHTGDVFRTNMYPIIDVYNGGSVSGMIDAMEIAFGMLGPDTKITEGMHLDAYGPPQLAQ